MKKISIIIPAYNEERRIERTLEEYCKFFRKLREDKKLDFEIIVVLNACTDNTLKITEGMKKKFGKIVILNFEQSGKGFAIIEGFKHAVNRKNDLIGFVDADMATRPEEFHDLIQSMGEHDVIMGSRYISGAIVNPKPSIRRRIVSRIFNLLIRSLFLMPYHDTQCGAKILRRETVKEIVNELVITRWAFDVDLLYKARGKSFKIKEFPTVWADKEYSKINFMKAGPKMALSIIRLRMLHSPFKKFIKVYDRLKEILTKRKL